MTDSERALLDTLPDEFGVYRGHRGGNRLGYSWTLSYPKARWFSDRWAGSRRGVLAAHVHKSDVHAVFTRRDEFEVVVDPDALSGVRSVRTLRRPKSLEDLVAEAVAQFRLSGSDHGPTHWEKVERNALTLSKLVPGCDVQVCRLFAVLHDSQRETETDDPDHGRRAADYCRSLGPHRLGLSVTRLDALCDACEGHEKGRVTSDGTIGVCWDADRLDLTRVGVVPDPALLSTEPGKSLIWRI